MVELTLNKGKEGRMRSRLKVLVAEKEQNLGRHISQKEIVKVTGLNPNTVSVWMSPEPITRIEEKVVVVLCQFLNCDMHDLVYIDWQPAEQAE